VALRIGVVILPDLPWSAALPRWREAEQRGFHTAWTYDHLSWRSLRDGPWLGAVPLLAAVAASTSTLRVGTLVTSPNFRHPALLAKDAMTLDEISGGRLDLGIGTGGAGYDLTAFGDEPPTLRQRTDRFVDFTVALDTMLTTPSGSYEGPVYRAPEYRTLPGCTQKPRVPFTIAATGPRGFDLASRYASCWVTYGPNSSGGEVTGPEAWYASVAAQVRGLEEACVRRDRDPADVRRMTLVSLGDEWVHGSADSWQDYAGRVADLGFTDVVVHWPRPHDHDLPGCDPHVFDLLSPGRGSGT
jgi:alkanesulfonate monooxygenase SsuD/methylene tetrahydromethanopterin reductase-like flavin-dependent oxidoreductase (luciferase family)